MLTQEEILVILNKFKQGNAQVLDELFENFKPMVSSISRGYFLVGGDEEDLLQEGMIGLYKAVQTYKPSEKATFNTFAYLCVLRQVQTAVRNSLRQKRASVNVCFPITDQGMIVVDEKLNSGIYLLSEELNPEESLIENETKTELTKAIKQILSELEFEVLSLYLKGFSYHDISSKLEKDQKSIFNAVARMKEKLQKFFEGEKNVSSIISKI